MSQPRSTPHGELQVYAQVYSRHVFKQITPDNRSIKVLDQEIIYMEGARLAPRDFECIGFCPESRSVLGSGQ